ncbi:hypothetical protein BN8_01814 [Fibrisoma limi BUZ 3]|uniref:Glycosyl transferase n=1 Tax=Fibrisoma limi BUZ 3 TaxID=1185876 RepID=I2GFW1_9BACT|nr:hypothetical protein [Fibrisoma limi]CCH52786.1 hypothetical protein BN8_01814 [Fibrisoma limi BUZ 3]
MLITVCTIRQLPQALALGASFRQYHPDAPANAFLIGLADDPSRLPTDVVIPHPVLSITDVLPAERLSVLSAMYTPTEFAAACKPHLIQAAMAQHPDDVVVYADPNCWFYQPLTAVTDRLEQANTLLTPHITRAPADAFQPDEKYFQNVGLYSGDFLAFRRSPETDRLLTWWQDRATDRAHIDFCNGSCLDQIWLMHVPVFFRGVSVVKNPSWHVAVWNLPQRQLARQSDHWLVNDLAQPTEGQPLFFVNFKGLSNPDDGLFPYQTRLRLANRPDVQSLLTDYQRQVSGSDVARFSGIRPAFGQRPEPMIIRGWRRITVQSLRAVTNFVEKVPLPVIR